MKKRFRVALAGNPNCGKTSIFNDLTGTRQHVGNYPGVTVESKSGTFEIGDLEIELIDLPGVYSLSSGSPEEEVVFNELTKPGNRPYPQCCGFLDSPQKPLPHDTACRTPHSHDSGVQHERRRPQKGNEIRHREARKILRLADSADNRTHGRRHEGACRKACRNNREASRAQRPHAHIRGGTPTTQSTPSPRKSDALKIGRFAHIPSRFFAIKLLENDSCTAKIADFNPVKDEVKEQIAHLSDSHAIDSESFMADRRYAMLAGACSHAISMTRERRREISDKIDSVMTNKYVGLPLFLAIIYLMFVFTFTCAQPFMDWIEEGFGFLSEFVQSVWSEDTLPFWRSMVTDGIIGGVGGVIVFLPNILFLFFAIAILEDSGYMARAAFVMDGVMRKFGLQGRSFVPLVLGFGCNVPAIMATRCIESDNDRKATVMVLPLMSCGARLPIYALVIPAFFAAQYQAAMMWVMYVIGVVVALFAAKLMRNTLFKGDGEVYLMELPPYRMPTLKSLLLHMWDRGKMYLHKAGTIILATSIILFIANTYPEKTVFSKDYDAMVEQVQKEGAAKKLSEEKIEEEVASIENEKSAEMLEYTVSGRIGKFLEPMFAPIGFDWKLTTASIGALAAKEVFVSQLGILYAEGEADEESETLREKLAKVYTPLQGFCMMLFSLMSIPCLATLAVMKRELNSWKLTIAETFGCSPSRTSRLSSCIKSVRCLTSAQS